MLLSGFMICLAHKIPDRLPINNGSPVAHLIKRDELEKVIRFVKDLVKATDTYVGNNL